MCQNLFIVIFLFFSQIRYSSIKTTFHILKTEVNIINNFYIIASKTMFLERARFTN